MDGAPPIGPSGSVESNEHGPDNVGSSTELMVGSTAHPPRNQNGLHTDAGSLSDIALNVPDGEEDEGPAVCAYGNHTAHSHPTPDDVLDMPPAEDAGTPTIIHLEDLKNTQHFIQLLRSASSDRIVIHPDVRERLRNPPTSKLELDDPLLRFALETWLEDTTVETYNRERDKLRRIFDLHIMSYDQIKRTWREKVTHTCVVWIFNIFIL